MAEFQIVANVLFQANPAQLAAMNRDLQSSIKPISVPFNTSGADALNRAVGTASQNLKSMREAAAAAGTGLNGLGQEVGRTSVLLETLANQSGVALRRIAAYATVGTVFVGLAAGIKNAVTEGVTFESQMAKLSAASGKSRADISALTGTIGTIATELGASSKELADASIQFSKLGLSSKDLETSLRAVAQASHSVNFDGVAGSTATALAAMRGFKTEASQLSEVLGSIDAVSNRFGTNGKEIADVIKVAGSSARQANTSLNELISIFASVRNTSEETGASVGSSLRLIFSRLQRNDTVTALRELGIELRRTRQEAEALGDVSLQGKSVGGAESLRRISAGIKNLNPTDSRYSAILQQVGGSREQARVLPLLQQAEDAERALVVAQTGAIQSTLAQEKSLDTLAGKAGQVSEQFLAMGRSLVGSNEFQTAAKTALSLASSFATLVENARPLLPLLTAIAGIKLTQSILSGNAVSGFLGGLTRSPIARSAGGGVPGVGDIDSVPAMLTPGEFVINKRAAAAIGMPNLHRLNAQGFADGGPVLSDEERRRRYPKDFRKPQILSDDARNNLITGNFERLSRGIGSSPFAKSLGDEADSIIAYKIAAQARTFDARKYANPTTGQNFTLEEASNPGGLPKEASTELNRVFRNYITQSVNRALGRGINSRNRESPTDIEAPQLAGLAANGTSPEQEKLLAGAHAAIQRHGSVAAAAKALRSSGLSQDQLHDYLSGDFTAQAKDAPAARLGSIRSFRARRAAESVTPPATAQAALPNYPIALRGNTLPVSLDQQSQQNPLRVQVVGFTTNSAAAAYGQPNQTSLLSYAGPARPGVAFGVPGGGQEAIPYRPDVFPTYGFASDRSEAGRVAAARRRRRQDTNDVFDLALGDANDVANHRLSQRQQRDFNSRFTLGPLVARDEPIQGWGSVDAGLTRPTIGQRVNGFIGRNSARAYRGIRGGVENFLSYRDEAIANRSTRSELGLYALAGVGAYGGSVVSNLGGDATTAATAGREGRFSAAQGIGGALSGAGTGAVLGSQILPGYGTAVGAIGGAAIGLVSSLQEAEKQIRQVKVAQAIDDFAAKLHSFSIGQGSATDVRESLNEQLVRIRARNADESTSFLGLSGFHSDEYGALNKRSYGELAGRLPDINQALGRQVNDLGKAGLSGEAIFNRVNGDPLNHSLLELAANIRRVPLTTVLDELKKTIEGSRRSLEIQNQALAGRQGGEANINSFGRLLLGVQAASSSLDDLKRKASVLGDAFDGVGQAVKVTAHADNLQGLGRPDNGFLEPLNIIRAIGGEQGNRLYQAGVGANSVAGVLPSVLAGAASSNPLSDSDFVTRTRRGAVGALGYTNDTLPAHVKQALDVAISGLNDKLSSGGIHSVSKELRVDASKFSADLLAAYTDSFKHIGGEIAKKIEDEANYFVQGVHTFTRRVAAVGETEDRASQAGVGALRVRTQVAAERAGQGGRYLDFLSLGQLEAGQQARQERLTGFRGAAAFDTTAISRGLAGANGRVVDLQAQQQKVFDQTGGQGPVFKSFVEQLAAARTQADNFRQALRHAADSSERLSVVQEKLAKLNQEQDSRRGLGERFLSGDPEDQLRIARGAQFAQAANAQGHVDNFTSDQRKELFDFLNSARNITLNLPRGQQTGQDALHQLIDNSAGGIFKLNPGQQNEQRGLQDELVKRTETAQKAFEELAKDQGRQAKEFYSTLVDIHKKGFEELNKNILSERITDVQNRLGAKGAELGDLRGLGQKREVLVAAGISNDDQLRRFRDVQPALEGLRKGNDAATTLGSAFDRAGSGASVRAILQQVQKGATAHDRVANLHDLLTEQGLDTQSVREITGRYQRINRFQDPEEQLGKAIADARGGALDRARLGSQDNIEKLKKSGFNPDALLAAGPKVDEAAKAFDGRSLDSLAKNLATVNGQFEALSKTLADLQKIGGGQAQAKAGGGSIFQSRGSDTVPAMLTPGEYVVNASSAKANKGLLEHINNAKGTAYLADGGDPYRRRPYVYDADAQDEARKNYAVMARNWRIEEEGRTNAYASLTDENRAKLDAIGNSEAARLTNPKGRILDRIAGWRRRGYSSDGVAYKAEGGDIEGETDFQRWKRQKAAQADQPTDFQKWKDNQNSNDKPATDFQRWKAGELKFGGPQIDGDFRKLKAKPIQADSGPTDFDIWKRDQENRGPTDFQQWKARQSAPAIPDDLGPHDAGPQVGGPDPAAAIEDIRDRARRGLAAGDLFDGNMADVLQRGAGQAADPTGIKIGRGGQPAAQPQRARGGVSPLAAALALYGNQNPGGASADFLTEYTAPKKFAGAILDQQATAGNIAAFQRRSLFGYIGGDHGQNAIAQGVFGEQEKRNALAQRLNPALQEARRARLPAGQIGLPFHFASGGIVPGAGLTDTIPSLLTPGEAVLNRGAVANVGADNVQRLNRGGVVKSQYLANGGQAQGGGADFGGFSEAASKLSEAINSFAGNATALTNALSQMPRTLTFSGTWQGTLTLNGAEVLSRIQPEFAKMVEQQIRDKVGQIFKEHLPDAGVTV